MTSSASATPAPSIVASSDSRSAAAKAGLDAQKMLEAQTFWDNRDWDWYKGNIPFFDCPDPDLVTAVSEFAHSDAEVVATVAHLVNSGAVRLCGNFKGARIELGPFGPGTPQAHAA